MKMKNLDIIRTHIIRFFVFYAVFLTIRLLLDSDEPVLRNILHSVFMASVLTGTQYWTERRQAKKKSRMNNE